MTDSNKLEVLEKRITDKLQEVYMYPKTEYAKGYASACKAVIKVIHELKGDYDIDKTLDSFHYE